MSTCLCVLPCLGPWSKPSWTDESYQVEATTFHDRAAAAVHDENAEPLEEVTLDKFHQICSNNLITRKELQNEELDEMEPESDASDEGDEQNRQINEGDKLKAQTCASNLQVEQQIQQQATAEKELAEQRSRVMKEREEENQKKRRATKKTEKERPEERKHQELEEAKGREESKKAKREHNLQERLAKVRAKLQAEQLEILDRQRHAEEEELRKDAEHEERRRLFQERVEKARAEQRKRAEKSENEKQMSPTSSRQKFEERKTAEKERPEERKQQELEEAKGLEESRKENRERNLQERLAKVRAKVQAEQLEISERQRHAEEEELRKDAEQEERRCLFQERVEKARAGQRKRAETSENEKQISPTSSRQKFEDRKREAEQEKMRRMEAQQKAKQHTQQAHEEWRKKRDAAPFSTHASPYSATFQHFRGHPVTHTAAHQSHNHRRAWTHTSQSQAKAATVDFSQDKRQNRASQNHGVQEQKWEQFDPLAQDSSGRHKSVQPAASQAPPCPTANKYAKLVQETDGQDVILTIKKKVLTSWALQPPSLKILRPVDELIATIHCALPPAFGVSSHEYFSKWRPISRDTLLTEDGRPDANKLKRAMRKLRFLLHTDKLPKDLDEEQAFLCKMLWDVASDAWEHFSREKDESGWVR